MSHRITYESKITDRDLALKALDSLGMTYQESGDSIIVTSGVLNRAILHPKVGKIDTDSDDHSSEDLNKLKIAYTEMQARREYSRNGVSVVSRQVVTYQGIEGVVLLKCRRAFG